MKFSIQHLYRNNVSMLCVSFVLFLTLCLTITFTLQQQQSARRTLSIQARMLASALSGGERISIAAATNALAMMDVNTQVQLACVTDARGNIRASHLGAAFDMSRDTPLRCEMLPALEDKSELVITKAAVVRANLPQPIGSVWIAATPVSPLSIVPGCFALAVPLGFLLALFCWYFGLKLHGALIKPIRQIASTAQRVSLYKDYSLRVVPGMLDDDMPYEIGSLTDSFNAMLKEIEDRDGRLTRKSAELDRARLTAEGANRAKSQFLANVSHELRTPLNAIIGFSDMLAEERFGPLGAPRYVEYARDIHDSGRHLLDVINDILDLSKAETGKLGVVFSSINLSKIIDKAMRIVAGQALERKVNVYTDMPERLPKIIADPVRLVQILLNLLSNAIKFTNEGGQVTVRLRAEAGRQGIHFFTIMVEDTGIGMTDEQIRNVFSSFNQADMGLNRKYEGAGLGLPLTKRLVELHHGKIKIESTLGEGTVVTVRLTSDPALLD